VLVSQFSLLTGKMQHLVLLKLASVAVLKLIVVACWAMHIVYTIENTVAVMIVVVHGYTC